MDEHLIPRRRKASRRSEILVAARQVFLEFSFDRASVSEIAARAGCVEGTLYTYFRNKRDLFDAVLAEFYDHLIAEMAPRFASISGTRDRLSYLVSRHLQISVDDTGVGRLIRESRTSEHYFGSILHQLNRRYSQFLVQTIRDGIERGEFRADLDVSVARDMLFGGLEHVSFNALGQGRRIDPARLGREITRQFIDGWTAPEAAEPSHAFKSGASGGGVGSVTRLATSDPLARQLDRIEQRLEQLNKRGGKKS